MSLIPVANLSPVSLIPATLICEYLREFSKKFETVLRAVGLGGNRFMKKTRSTKSRDTVPLKGKSCISKIYFGSLPPKRMYGMNGMS